MIQVIESVSICTDVAEMVRHVWENSLHLLQQIGRRRVIHDRCQMELFLSFGESAVCHDTCGFQSLALMGVMGPLVLSITGRYNVFLLDA